MKLRMDLETDQSAFSKEEIINQIDKNYQSAVNRMDACLKDGTVSEAAAVYFMNHVEKTHRLVKLLPFFGADAQGLNDTSAYMAFLNSTVKRFELRVIGCNLSGSDEPSIHLACQFLDKISSVYEHFSGLADPNLYSDLQGIVLSKICTVHDDGETSLSEENFSLVASSLVSLSVLNRSKISEHLPSEGKSIQGMLDSLLQNTVRYFKDLQQTAEVIVKKLIEGGAVGTSKLEIDDLGKHLNSLVRAKSTNWGGILDKEFVPGILLLLENMIAGFFEAVCSDGIKMLGGTQQCTGNADFTGVGIVFEKLSSLQTLPGVNVERTTLFSEFSKQASGKILQLCSEIEQLMNDVSDFAASGCKITDLRGVQPTLCTVPVLMNYLLEAKWIDGCREGSHQECIDMVENAVKHKAKTLVNVADGFGLVLTEESVNTLHFILVQFDYLCQTKIETLEKQKADVSTCLGGAVVNLREKLKSIFPSNESGVSSALMEDQANIHLFEFLGSLEFLVISRKMVLHFRERTDMVIQLQEVEEIQAGFNRCAKNVIVGIKNEIEKSLSGINEETGLWELENPDLLSSSLREGLKMLQMKSNPEFACIHDHFDFLIEIRERLLRMHEKLSKSLYSCEQSSEIDGIKKLLRVVRALSDVDDYEPDPSRSFRPLLLEYNAKLISKLEQQEQQIIECIDASKFDDAAIRIARLYPGGEVAREIQAELSNNVSKMIISLYENLRSLTQDLQPELLQEIYTKWLTLVNGKSAIDYTSVSVKQSYAQLMNSVVSDSRSGFSRKGFKDELAQKLTLFKSALNENLKNGRYQRVADMIEHFRELTPFKDMFGINMQHLADEMSKDLKSSIEAKCAQFKSLEVKDYAENPPLGFFRLFEPESQELVSSVVVAMKFKDNVDDVWNDVSQKINRQIEIADFGRGSLMVHALEKTIISLPDGKHKAAAQELFSTAKQESEKRRQDFGVAVESLNAQLCMTFAVNGKPFVKAEFLQELERCVAGIIKQVCDGLDNQPCLLHDDPALINKLKFVQDLKCTAACPEDFSKKWIELVKRLKGSLGKAEDDARANLVALMNAGGESRINERFPDLDSTFTFLESLLLLKLELSQNRSVQAQILPDRYGQHLINAFQCVVSNYLCQLKAFDTSLKLEPVDEHFDVEKMVSLLKFLTSKSDIFKRANLGLAKLQDQKVGSCVVEIYPAESSPESLVNRVREFVLEIFHIPPDLSSKIALSSERTKLFQSLGKRVAADKWKNKFEEFVSGESNCDIRLILNESFSEKVLNAVKQLWDTMNGLVKTLSGGLAIENYRSDHYLASEDQDLRRHIKDCEKVNMMHDHLELFLQHVKPFLPDTVGCSEFNLEELESKLLCQIQDMANKIVENGDFDEVAGLLVCLQIRQQELLFQSVECKRIIEQCLHNYQTNGAGKGAGISKLGFKLAGRKFRPFGEQSLQNYEAFQGYRAKAFREKTERYDQTHVLKEMKHSGDKGSSLLAVLFNEFEQKYKSTVEECLCVGFTEAAGSSVVQKLRDDVKKLEIKHSHDKINWTKEIRSAIPSMVANIFAVWTFHHSKRFLSAMEEGDRKDFLFKPHPVQVIAIFCMLGLDEHVSTGDLERSLVQVPIQMLCKRMQSVNSRACVPESLYPHFIVLFFFLVSFPAGEDRRRQNCCPWRDGFRVWTAEGDLCCFFLGLQKSKA